MQRLTLAIALFVLHAFCSQAAAQCVTCLGDASCGPAGGNGYLRCQFFGESVCVNTGFCAGLRNGINACAASPNTQRTAPGGDQSSATERKIRLEANSAMLLQLAQSDHLMAIGISKMVGRTWTSGDLAHARVTVLPMNKSQALQILSGQPVHPAIGGETPAVAYEVSGVEKPNGYRLRVTSTSARGRDAILTFEYGVNGSDLQLSSWQ